MIHLNSQTNAVWLNRLEGVLNSPLTSSPRGFEIREVIGRQSVIPTLSPFIISKCRNMHHPFLFGEAAWILSGDDSVEGIEKFNRHIVNFSDDGKKFFGAYGPKYLQQVGYVVEKLIEDPDSRQAVINIWRENPPQTKDVPCTLSLQFLMRDGELHAIATMRSSDLWLGWVYDMFNFSMMVWDVVIRYNSLTKSDVTPGHLYHTPGSLHLYEPQFTAAQRCLDETLRVKPVDFPMFCEIDSTYELKETLWHYANKSLPQK